jgi:peptide/nickel transport system substrate-binding protein
MKRRIIWSLLVSIIAVSLVLTSCGGEEEEETLPETEEEITIPETEEEVLVPETEKEVTLPETEKGVPQYGGTLTTRITSGPTAWDPYFSNAASGPIFLVYETLGMANWMDPDANVNNFLTRFVSPENYTGLIAESWETEDFQTITIHIRQGVYFQDIPPTNGRELTAYDVQYHYHRMLGIGSGYTEKTIYTSMAKLEPVESVTVTDKYTLVIKLKEASIWTYLAVIDDYIINFIPPQDAIEFYGDLNDWDRAIGTGPYKIIDNVSESSVTLVKNPNYYMFDERYPDNQLPYIDKVKFLVIPDLQTALAALRTGKIDFIEGIDWETKASLEKTNPELNDVTLYGNASTIAMRTDKEPFNDIRVRKALQMAIDLKTLCDTYYGGTWDGTPVGLIMHEGWRAEYDDWPQEVKDSYAYNPEEAKKLLAEAGYPDGFKCTVTISRDSDLYIIIKEYLADIGVDMEINLMESAAWTPYIRAGKAEMSSGWMGGAYLFMESVSSISMSSSYHWLIAQTGISDPYVDETYKKMLVTLDIDECKKMSQEADAYIIAQHWRINLVPSCSSYIYQPWVKGYKEVTLGMRYGQHFSRWWIDPELK